MLDRTKLAAGSLSLLLLGLSGAPLFGADMLNVGVHGGLNLATQTFGSTAQTAAAAQGLTAINTGTRTGLELGATAAVPIMPMLYFHPELNYVQRGLSFNATLQGQSVAVTSKIDYLELPLLVQAKFDAGPLHPYVLAGPSIELAVHRSVDTTPAGGATTSSDASNADKSFDFGVYGGAGAEYGVTDSVFVTVEARYYLGILDTDQGGSGLRNRGFSFLGGVGLSL